MGGGEWGAGCGIVFAGDVEGGEEIDDAAGGILMRRLGE